jgi:hypothetical protein
MRIVDPKLYNIFVETLTFSDKEVAIEEHNKLFSTLQLLDMLGEVLNQVSMFKNLQFISALCS